MQLENKTALITGAGAKGGIGAAIASLFAREGAHVLITGRDAQRGEQAVAEIASAGGDARFLLADLSDLDDIARLAEEAGDVDVLVNNAAVFPFAPTVEQDTASYDEVFATNVRAPYFLTAALVPSMLAKASGSIINISTMVATFGLPGLSVYGATKAALESLTRTWAAEFSPGGVRVNVISPGPTRSEKAIGAMGEAAEQLGRTTPLGRMAATAEIAEAVLFLASDRASYITGAVIPVDGGRTAV